MSAPLFPLGQIVATPGALDASRYPCQFLELLARHVRGDWGCIDPEDGEANSLAVIEGDRILSAYAIDPALPRRPRSQFVQASPYSPSLRMQNRSYLA